MISNWLIVIIHQVTAQISSAWNTTFLPKLPGISDSALVIVAFKWPLFTWPRTVDVTARLANAVTWVNTASLEMSSSLKKQIWIQCTTLNYLHILAGNFCISPVTNYSLQHICAKSYTVFQYTSSTLFVFVQLFFLFLLFFLCIKKHSFCLLTISKTK